MSITVKQGNSYKFMHEDEMQVCNEGLPPATYVAKLDERSGSFFLEKVSSFQLPSKLYGDLQVRAKRVLQTFFDRPLSTGVMLTGVKGSGKTLLAKHIATSAAANHNMPTIIINQPLHGDEFNKFIQSIDVPAVILFDEFEKVYKYDTQESVLTLLDGVFPSKKLFIITTNDQYAVDKHIRNRPGRVYYKFEFTTLTQDFIKEYCVDNLKDTSQISSIIQYTQVFNFFNFDMLAAAIEEMNRYGETLPEVLDVLNIMPETSTTDSYTLSVAVNNKSYIINKQLTRYTPNNFEWTLWGDDDMPKILAGDLDTKHTIESIVNNTSSHSTSSDSVFEDECIRFTAKHITAFNPKENKFTYEMENNGVKLAMYIQRNIDTNVLNYSSLVF